MSNDVKLQEGHPVDENLRPIKVGGKSTAIETAQHGNGCKINGDLTVTGEIKGKTDITLTDDITCDALTATSINSFKSTNLIIDDSGDITLDAAGGDVTVLQADLTMPIDKKVIFGNTGEYIVGDDTDLGIVSSGDITISTGAGGGGITLQENDASAYAPTADADATTKRYVDNKINCPSIPFYFNETTTSRTYFRNADDVYNAWEWDSYDTEDSTSVDATINLAASNLLAGYIVGFGCTLVGATWNTYQANAVSGVAAFQIWTSDPSDSSVATLRTTDTITANRAHTTTSTSAIDIGLNAGDVVIPAIQYISGTATIWYGGVTLLFTR